MKDRNVLILAALLAWFFWPKRSVDVGWSQTCIFPDGSSVTVPLGDPCPYDSAHGGQSGLEPYEN